MNIFAAAAISAKNNTGYKARKFFILWKNKSIPSNWFGFEYGIRWSDKFQFFPVWNMSNNTQKSILFGFAKLYFQIIYQK